MTQWVRTPTQARSRDTLSRIFRVTEDLMAEGGYDSASINEIVKRANTSTGAFYARFDNKEALFHALHEQFLADAKNSIEESFGPARLADDTLRSLIERLVTHTLELYRTHGGLLKAVFYHTRINPSDPFVARSTKVNRALVSEVGRILLARSADIRHPRPKQAVQFAVTVLVSTLRETVVFGSPGLLPRPVSNRALVRETTDVIYRYLACADA